MNFRSARSTRIAITEPTHRSKQCSYSITSSARAAARWHAEPESFGCLEIDDELHSSAATVLVLDRRAFGGQAGAQPDRELPRLTEPPAWPHGTRLQSGQKFGAEIAIPMR